MDQPSNKDLYKFLDITTLNSTDTPKSVEEFAQKTMVNHEKGFSPAAICVFPNFSAIIADKVGTAPIAVAAVAGCFPASQSFAAVKLLEAKMAVEAGATEIDIVLNIGQFLNGNDQVVIDEIRAVKEIIGQAKLKVILETGVLRDVGSIKHAAKLAILGGADFLKTSTGKVGVGATPEAVRALCEVIREELLRSSRRIGIKVSGGVRTKQDALDYYSIVNEILGDDFCHPNFFRIGASGLADELSNE